MDPISFDNINCVIFDFAFTLCSELYFKEIGIESESKITEFIFRGDNIKKWSDPWMSGELTSKDICKYLSDNLPFSSDDIYSALCRGCSHLDMNQEVYNFAKALAISEKKTALVTINADIFSQIVVPQNGFDSIFDIIVNSADEHEIDKGKLLQYSLDLFGSDITFGTSLLIDDSPIVDWFRAQGGYAYRYTDDDSFGEWMKTNIQSV
ncbi:hypothetical protein ACFLZG_00090 [Thermodesulfobacteriota bacterium]